MILTISGKDKHYKIDSLTITLYEMKLVLINLIKGDYYDKIEALMILVNKKLYLNKMQMIEFVSYTLNLNYKSDFAAKVNEANFDNYNFNKNCFGGLRNFENLIIGEELVNEIYLKQNLRSSDLLSSKAIMEYFTCKYN